MLTITIVPYKLYGIRQRMALISDGFTVQSTDNDYACGYKRPRYPMPALQVDSCNDLGERWSSFMDTDASCGVRW